QHEREAEDHDDRDDNGFDHGQYSPSSAWRTVSVSPSTYSTTTASPGSSAGSSCRSHTRALHSAPSTNTWPEARTVPTRPTSPLRMRSRRVASALRTRTHSHSPP